MNRQPYLISSRIQTPDGTILTSKHRHDYQTHVDANGETYMLDGGREYQRVSVNKVPFKNISVYSDSPFEMIREAMLRGTFTNDGKFVWVPLAYLTDKHLSKLLDYAKELDQTSWIEFIPKEIQYRKDNNIQIPEYDYKKFL